MRWRASARCRMTGKPRTKNGLTGVCRSGHLFFVADAAAGRGAEVIARDKERGAISAQYSNLSDFIDKDLLLH